MSVHAMARQRVGPLAGLPALLSEFGVSIDDALSGTGIAPDDLVADKFIPLSQGLRLLEQSVNLTGCRHFGLLLGTRHDHQALGIIGQLMQTAPTLMDAVHDFVNWQIGYSSGAVLYLHRFENEFAVGYGVYDRQSPGRTQLYDLAMAVGNNLIRGLTNGVARPDAIYLGHRRPDDVQPYERLLNAPLHFDQSQTCLILSRTSMNARIPGADPERRKLLLDQLSQAAAHDGKPNSARIRHLLRPQFLRGDPSMASIAAMLRTSVRTLGRALAREENGVRGPA